MTKVKHFLTCLACTALAMAMTGCPVIIVPPGTVEYELGFWDGFLQDDYYWDGYDDSYDTIDFGPILYSGSSIPLVEEPPFDSGYYDGLWFAYNDGYFTSYRYAFIIGFSEGYDNAYWGDYLDFLATDLHTEYLDGGWSDGYSDGFSEGRVFGAADYEAGFNFDWLDALWDYESGTDLYFEEVDVGTGLFGPVFLYEYGTDPNTFAKTALAERPGLRSFTPAIRHAAGEKEINLDDDDLYRPLNEQAQQNLDVEPAISLRSEERPIRLGTSWLQRVLSYTASKGTKPARKRVR